MNRLTGRSWQHLLLVLTLAVSLSVAGAVAAQDEDAGAPEAAEEASADAAEDLGADARWFGTDDSRLEGDRSGRNFSSRRETREGRSLSRRKCGHGSVAVEPMIRRWGKSRSLAYTKAFIECDEGICIARIRERMIESGLLRDLLDAEDLDESEFVYQPGESTDDYGVARGDQGADSR